MHDVLSFHEPLGSSLRPFAVELDALPSELCWLKEVPSLHEMQKRYLSLKLLCFWLCFEIS